MITGENTITEVDELEEIDISDILGQKLVLFNDPVNSFEHVVGALCRHLKFTENQAHQCALIAHTKGKYAIKEGTYESLEPIQEVLSNEGLTVEIQ